MLLTITRPIGKQHSEVVVSLALVSLVLLSSLPLSSAFTTIARHHQPPPSYCKTTSKNSLTMTNPAHSSSSDDSSNLDEITILGFGSLLSLKSARLTFPTLKNFRLGRVPNHRRVFAHPASIFFQRDIANLDTLEMSSLSCEYHEGQSFICSVFEVPNEGLSAASTSDGDEKKAGSNNWVPSQAYLEREEEFEIAMVPYYEEMISMDGVDNVNNIVPMRTETSLSEDTTTSSDSNTEKPTAIKKEGVICCRSTDEAYISLWGEDHWKRQYLNFGVKTIWGWGKDSGLRPCATYLRHCVLASWNCGGGETNNDSSWSSDGSGGRCYNSFLDETYLVDRKTTIRDYLKRYPDVMSTEPPESLRERYGG